MISDGFKELENITADLGIKAWGKDLEGAFTSIAHGLASLLSDPPEDQQLVTRTIRVEAPSVSSLLVQFLNEIIYLEDTDGLLPVKVTSLHIRNNTLEADLIGFVFDPEVHDLKSHIKAATYHGLEIAEEEDCVIIKVIFDV